MSDELFDGSRDAFEIINKILPAYIPQFEKHYNYRNAQEINLDKLIKLYLNLVGVAQEEIRQLLIKALNSNYLDKKDEKTLVDYSTRDFYEFLIECSLWWMTSRQLCKYIPKIVVEIAKTVWISSREEIDRYSRMNETEYEFGVTDNHDYQYFPASSKQTFLSHLLEFNPDIGVDFIIDFVNESCDFYHEKSKREYDKTKKNELPEFNKSLIGNLKLWDAYRGSGNTPYLIESLLMSLEAFLLTLFENNDDKSANQYCNIILENSNNVATISIVASLCMAYPFKVEKSILKFILSPKEFVLWDNTRSVGELTNRLAPIDPRKENPYLQEERYKFNNLEHRKTTLERLIFLLSFYKGYNVLIFKIIDNHLIQLENSKNYERNIYGLSINRMDRRHYDSKVVKEGENIVVEFKPIVKEEFKDFAIGDNDVLPHHEFLSAWNWGNEILNKNNLDNNTYENWQKYFEQSKERLERPTIDINNFDNYCSGIALIGLKYHLRSLSREELEWCKKIILDTSNYFVSKKGYLGLGNEAYSIVNEDPSMQAIPYLFLLEEIDSKEIILLSLKYILKADFNNGLTSPRLEKFCKEIWIVDSNSAKRIVYCLIHLANEEYERHSSIESVLNDFDIDKIKDPTLQISDFSYSFTNSDLLDKTFFIISGSSQLDEKLENIISIHIDYVFTYQNIYSKSNDNQKNFYISHNFSKNFARTVLTANETSSINIFNKFVLYYIEDIKKTLSYSQTAFKFGFDVLEEIIYYVDRLPHDGKEIVIYDRFIIIWKELFLLTIQTKVFLFTRILLLGIDWKDSASTWKPLNRDKIFFQGLISVFVDFRLDYTIKFISTIGNDLFLFNSITDVANALKKNENIEFTNNYYSEKLIQKCFTLYGSKIKSDPEKKESFLLILDRLVEEKSAIAYLIRESFVT